MGNTLSWYATCSPLLGFLCLNSQIWRMKIRKPIRELSLQWSSSWVSFSLSLSLFLFLDWILPEGSSIPILWNPPFVSFFKFLFFILSSPFSPLFQRNPISSLSISYNFTYSHFGLSFLFPIIHPLLHLLFVFFLLFVLPLPLFFFNYFLSLFGFCPFFSLFFFDFFDFFDFIILFLFLFCSCSK